VTVLVDQTTKDLGPSDGSVAVGTIEADVGNGWPLLQRAMRAVRVVVVLILAKCGYELPIAEDQHPVPAFSATVLTHRSV
jgi:hypothetical protein